MEIKEPEDGELFELKQLVKEMHEALLFAQEKLRSQHGFGSPHIENVLIKFDRWTVKKPPIA